MSLSKPNGSSPHGKITCVAGTSITVRRGQEEDAKGIRAIEIANREAPGNGCAKSKYNELCRPAALVVHELSGANHWQEKLTARCACCGHT